MQSQRMQERRKPLHQHQDSEREEGPRGEGDVHHDAVAYAEDCAHPHREDSLPEDS